MNDCPNAVVRDLLPDLVHGHLRADARRMIEQHLAGCADCRAELGLLRDLRGSLGRTPALDLAAIAAAVPAYGKPLRRSWVGWRTAAAITVLVAGGSSLALLQRPVGPEQSAALRESAVATSSVPLQRPVQVDAGITGARAPLARTSPLPSLVAGPVERATVGAAPSAGAVVEGTPARNAGGRELAMAAGSLNDLSDRELTSLLRDIESLDAVPSLDVDNTSIAPIAPEDRRKTPGAP